jgi:hypothetical protein
MFGMLQLLQWIWQRMSINWRWLPALLEASRCGAALFGVSGSALGWTAGLTALLFYYRDFQ